MSSEHQISALTRSRVPFSYNSTERRDEGLETQEELCWDRRTLFFQIGPFDDYCGLTCLRRGDEVQYEQPC
jgi:hypothetical protein